MRNRIGPAVQVGLWLVDWAASAWLTRWHHPTPAIDAAATACLISACAAAVYVDSLVLTPRFWGRGRRWAYAMTLLATVATSAAVGVALIQVVYDVAWGPDPARYGLAFNLATDSLGVAIHVVAVWPIRRALTR